jgi:hypothetical protein
MNKHAFLNISESKVVNAKLGTNNHLAVKIVVG